MEYCAKFFEKEFTATESKKAYLKACKWVAVNVINKVTDIGETTWNITKVYEDEDKTTFKLTLYCTLGLEDEHKKFCENCKQMHSLFYVNEEYNCSRCNMITFYKRSKDRLEIKVGYRKERIGFLLEKSED